MRTGELYSTGSVKGKGLIPVINGEVNPSNSRKFCHPSGFIAQVLRILVDDK